MSERGAVKLDIADLTKRFGTTLAVDNATFQVSDGEFFTLLGPSGCGKSTILGLIAGTVDTDEGRIALDGQDIGAEPIHRRDVALVFQQYALFPHMTVFDNVAFGLKMRGVPRREIAQRVGEALALVRLDEHPDRYPRQLSGGQQQRVALARAIVVRPRLLLLDEPLSNLDAKLRAELRSDLRDIQRATRLTTVFVTHDLSEAFEMSDRVAVMAAGKIRQIGTPIDLYSRPASLFVARFLGHANHIRGRVAEVSAGEVTIVTDEGWTAHAALGGLGDLQPGEAVWLVLPSDRLSVISEPGGGANRIEGIVEKVIFLGSGFRYLVRCAGSVLQVEMQAAGVPGFEPGDRAFVEWPAGAGILVRDDGGA